jgi:DNA-binding transcriptional MerR regulator
LKLLTIGEFARLTRLSPKALRLYDQLGLVMPAQVDPASGYRLYAVSQVEPARLVSALRRLGMPLARISAVLGLSPDQAADAVDAYWAEQEAEAEERKTLARYLIEKLKGHQRAMFQIEVHQIPARKLLTMTKHVHASEIEGFVDQARTRLLTAAPRLPGYAGAPFLAFYGEVSDDSDGPVEFCRPVDPDIADDAIRIEGVEVRAEPIHDDISIRIAPGSTWPQVLPAFDALSAWVTEHHREPRPGIREVFVVNAQVTPPELIGIDLTVSLR